MRYLHYLRKGFTSGLYYELLIFLGYRTLASPALSREAKAAYLVLSLMNFMI